MEDSTSANPYQSPSEVEEHQPSEVTPRTSLIWFAATVAVVTTITTAWMAIAIAGWTDPNDIMARTLLPTALLTVAAAPVFGTVNYLYKKRVDYGSTPMSLIVTGLIVGCYASAVHYFILSPLPESVVWLIGLAVGVPVCWVGSVVDRRVARVTKPRRPPAAVAELNHASMFWFAGASLLFGFFVGIALYPGPGFYFGLINGLISAAMLCLVGTVAYALFDAIVPRSRAATRKSRIAAAAVYSGLAWITAYLLETYNAPPGMLRLLAVAALALPAVACDRIVASRRPIAPPSS